MEFFEKLVKLSMNIELGKEATASYSKEIEQAKKLSFNLKREAIMYLDNLKKVHLRGIFEECLDSYEDISSIPAKYLPEFLEILNECQVALHELLNDKENQKIKENNQEEEEENNSKDDSLVDDETLIRAIKESLKGSEYEVIDNVDDVKKVEENDNEMTADKNSFVRAVQETIGTFDESAEDGSGCKKEEDEKEGWKDVGGKEKIRKEEEEAAFIRSVKETLEEFEEGDEIADSKHGLVVVDGKDDVYGTKGEDDEGDDGVGGDGVDDEDDDEAFLRAVKADLEKYKLEDEKEGGGKEEEGEEGGGKIEKKCTTAFGGRGRGGKWVFEKDKFSLEKSMRTRHDLINRATATGEQGTRGILKARLNSFQTASFLFHEPPHLPLPSPSPCYTSSTPYFQTRQHLPQDLHSIASTSCVKHVEKVTFRLTPDYKIISDDSGSINTSDIYKHNTSDSCLNKHNTPDNKSFHSYTSFLSNSSFHDNSGFPGNRSSYLDDRLSNSFLSNNVKVDKPLMSPRPPRASFSDENLASRDHDVIKPLCNRRKAQSLNSRFGFKHFYENMTKGRVIDS